MCRYGLLPTYLIAMALISRHPLLSFLICFFVRNVLACKFCVTGQGDIHYLFLKYEYRSCGSHFDGIWISTNRMYHLYPGT